MVRPPRRRRVESPAMDLSSPASGPRVAGLIVGGIGLVFAIAGTLIATYAPGAIAARHARMQALSQPGAGSLADRPHAEEVLVDGRIAGDQPVLVGNFVAYVKEELERNHDDKSTWNVRERRTPPLRILLTGDDVARVVNRDYSVSG